MLGANCLQKMSSEHSLSATSGDADNAALLSAYIEDDEDKEEGIPGEQGACCLSQ
jgi:hypothetical protein